MNRYHFRIYTGPTAVKEVSDRLTAERSPWQHVTIVGTEHVHFSIEALYQQAADREIPLWFERAKLTSLLTGRVGGASLVRAEAV